MSIEWVDHKGPLPERPVFGHKDTAEIVVEVFLDDDGMKGYYTECLCASCDLIDQIGVEDAVGKDLEEGTYYMTHHVEVYHGVPAVSVTEYDVWLVPSEPKEAT